MEQTYNNKNITLLIADDEAAIRNGLSTVVPWEEFGITIAGTAQDGIEAYELICRFRPDIVITDIRMPGMDGLEMMEKVRSDKLGTNFIILSGYDDFKYAQKAIQLGAKNYFLKPIKIDELVTEIRNQKAMILQKDHISSYSTYLNVKSNPKEKFLKRLLKNEFFSYEEIEEEVKALDIRLCDAPCRVMVFSIQKDEENDYGDEYLQIKYLIDITGKVLSETRYEFLMISSGELLAVIHTEGEDGQPVDYHYLAGKCLSHVKRDSTTRLFVGIGKEVKHLTDCPASYKTALLSLSYLFYTGQKKIFDESVICRDMPYKSAGDVDYCDLLYDLVLNRRDQIWQFCTDFFAQLFYTPTPPPSYIKGMCIYLITDILKELNKRQEGLMEFSQSEVILQINQIRSFEELKAYILDFLLACGGKMSCEGKKQKNQIIQAAEYYIEAHMGEKILAKDVAKHVNLSDVYFTSYFKMKTGTNFRDYVIRSKMEYVKNLMGRLPAMPVAEVAASIGYDDYRSFYRIFKQYTGVNPSEYTKHTGL